jgi:hypothetical protein
MTEPILHPWADVNNYMRDDYRLLVATMAARAVGTAPQELETLARTAFNSITVPGARSFFRADLVQQRKALARAMPNSPQLTALVIALWSLAAASQINLLRQAGETASLQFAPDRDWQKALDGFYDFDDIPLLTGLADGLGEHASAQDADHFKLAALWLGPAVTNRDALFPSAEDVPADSDASTDSIADEPE